MYNVKDMGWILKSMEIYHMDSKGIVKFNFVTSCLAMDDMNDSGSWAPGSRSYEQLKAMDDMNGYMLWAQGCRCYELLWVVDGMNDSRLWD